MKWNYKSTLALITGLAVILPVSAFAEDQKKQDNGKGGGHAQGGRAAPQRSSNAAPSGGRSNGGNTHGAARVNNASGGQGYAGHNANRPATVRQTTVAPVTTQNVKPVNKVARTQRNQNNVAPVTSQNVNQSNHIARTQRNTSAVAPADSQNVLPASNSTHRQHNQSQTSSNQRQYNKGNHYGGLWTNANTHSDWNRNGRHHWNNHDYRWFDGGWLIIDGGYTPDYSIGSSIETSVQMRLSDQGYYHGPIDGEIGPGSRNAIANYQGDHGLNATGQINEPLLQSLGLE